MELFWMECNLTAWRLQMTELVLLQRSIGRRAVQRVTNIPRGQEHTDVTNGFKMPKWRTQQGDTESHPGIKLHLCSFGWFADVPDICDILQPRPDLQQHPAVQPADNIHTSKALANSTSYTLSPSALLRWKKDNLSCFCNMQESIKYMSCNLQVSCPIGWRN